jgi:hypothetical protein
MNPVALIFPLFGVVMITVQIRQGYVLSRSCRPWFYRDAHPIGFWAVIAWYVLWSITAAIVLS